MDQTRPRQPSTGPKLLPCGILQKLPVADMLPVYLQRDAKLRRSRLASVQEETADLDLFCRPLSAESRRGMRTRFPSAETLDVVTPSARAKRKNTTFAAAMELTTEENGYASDSLIRRKALILASAGHRIRSFS